MASSSLLFSSVLLPLSIGVASFFSSFSLFVCMSVRYLVPSPLGNGFKDCGTVESKRGGKVKIYVEVERGLNVDGNKRGG